MFVIQKYEIQFGNEEEKEAFETLAILNGWFTDETIRNIKGKTAEALE